MAARTATLLYPLLGRAGAPLRRRPHRWRTWFSPQSCSRSLAGITPALSPQLAGRSYPELYALSVEEPELFWGSVARDRLAWSSDFQQVSDCDLTAGRVSWFRGGKLNVSVNCLDVHAAKDPDRVALIWEKDEPGTEERVTYRELLEMTCRIANTLKSLGVQKGDRVAIYMPVSPIAVATMLGCARIGAVHTVVFAGFSSEALAGRIQDAQCKVVVTCNQGVRGGRLINLKATVDSAVKNCPTVEHVLVAQRTNHSVPMGKLDTPLEEAMARESSECAPEPMDSEEMLFMLYTSGSTGKPKGIVHTQAGYLLYASLTHQYVFDYSPGDVYGCVADIGWITGHSYVVYGPLCNGATTVLFESTPVYPDPGRYWEMVERLRINQFYGAPTAIRLLLKYEESWVKKYDRSSLKTLGSVGEPINHEAWEWFHNVVGDGRCPLVDTWWVSLFLHGCISMGCVSECGQMLTGNDVTGALCISKPWPGMAKTIFGDHQRFVDAYFKPYPVAFAFVVLKDNTTENQETVIEDLRHLVATKIAKYAVPDHFLVVKRLPKTRSGKIMRRILRKVAMQQTESLGDISTLDDPSVVTEIIQAHERYRSRSAKG
uniref:Propionate--CoA ligase n=1 Tax=Astyanax mexicanus TaxID=7994 RepID=W5K4Q0_ASTMX